MTMVVTFATYVRSSALSTSICSDCALQALFMKGELTGEILTQLAHSVVLLIWVDSVQGFLLDVW